MTRAALVLVGLAVASGGCKSDTDESTTPASSGGGGSGSSAASKPGFGAELNADLTGGSGSGSGSAAATATGSGSPAAGSGNGSAAAVAVAPASGSGAGSAKPPVVAAGSNAPIPNAPPPSTSPRVPAKVPADIAAIKLSLQPNWDRDIGDPATISLVVKRPSGAPAVFTFNYGYDDPRAPIDRDAYLKFLTDSKILVVTVNRQRGSAWYIEGTDASGAPSFRYLVNYGGKHLICGGLLYKDKESSAMGDIRDEVVNQAKKICETLAL